MKRCREKGRKRGCHQSLAKEGKKGKRTRETGQKTNAENGQFVLVLQGNFGGYCKERERIKAPFEVKTNLRDAENVSEKSAGPPAPEPRQVSKKSREQIRKDSFDTFRRLSRDFPDCSRDFLETFRGSGAGGPGRHFRDFFGISDPKGPKHLSKGGTTQG